MTGDTIRAWQSSEDVGIEALSVADLPAPTPGDGELLIDVEAAALNFSDLLMIDGMYQIRPDRPFVPGQEIAGTVLEAGPDAGVAPGTRVAGKVLWGGFAERALMRADMAIPLPDGIDAATGVALPVVYTTAQIALIEEAGLKAGDRVLVHAAAGGVGLAAVQIAKAAGATVIGLASGAEKCALVREQGADLALDYKDGAFSDAVKAATDGHGADIVLDTVGGDATKESLRCIAWGGQLLIVGFSSGDIPQIAANRLLLRRAVARGIYWDHDKDGPMIAKATEALVQGCLDGTIKPVVNAAYGFDDLPKALGDLRAGKSVGKLVLTMGDGA